MSTITPQSSGAPRARSVHSSNGKENQANSRPNSDSAAKMAKRAEARNASRLHKPLSAQTIFEQKSAEGKELGSVGEEGVKRLSDAMDEEAEPLEPLTCCPIALALRGTDRDYTRVEGVLDTKLPGKKPTGIKELNERLEVRPGPLPPRPVPPPPSSVGAWRDSSAERRERREARAQTSPPTSYPHLAGAEERRHAAAGRGQDVALPLPGG